MCYQNVTFKGSKRVLISCGYLHQPCKNVNMIMFAPLKYDFQKCKITINKQAQQGYNYLFKCAVKTVIL